MKNASTTPIRQALTGQSSLRPQVKDGLGALEKAHRQHLQKDLLSDFADSLDIDSGLRVGNEQQHRWDYLLGHAPTQKLIAVEPHSARQGEVETVIRKREAARMQLRPHLKSGARIHKWLWVASGKVHFAQTEKAVVKLNQHGIEFVPRQIQSKHLS